MKLKKNLILALLLLLPVASHAVLKERNLHATLKVLRVELEKAYADQQIFMKRLEGMTAAQHKSLVSIMERSSQISLMLYSQKQNYTFDLTYACGQATQLYREFNRKRVPYDRIVDRIETEIKRYEGLIATLKGLPPAIQQDSQTVIQVIDSLMPIDSLTAMLPAQPGNEQAEPDTLHPLVLTGTALSDRQQCVRYAELLLSEMLALRDRVEQDNNHYNEIAASLKDLFDYATSRYHDIQRSIFVNGDQSYFATLFSLPMAIKRAKQDVQDKYDDSAYSEARSEWRGPIVYGFSLFILFFFIASAIVGNLLVRTGMRFVPQLHTERFLSRKKAIIISASVLLFAISIMVTRSFIHNDFIGMATGLLAEYAWMLLAITLSLLIRLDSSQLSSGYRIYLPIALMGLIIISFRIIFIPNYLVSLLFPPILLVFTWWQWTVIRHHHPNLPKSDVAYTWISMAVMLVSCVLSWAGYVLMSVQILIWWLFQLTAIQTITCVFDLLDLLYERTVKQRMKDYRQRHKALYVAQQGKIITVTWWFDLLHQVLVPVVGVLSVLYCIYWASDVFDLRDTCIGIFLHPFLQVEGLISVSLFKLVVVVAAFFVFKYVVYFLKSAYRHFRLKRAIADNNGKPISRNEINLTLVNNVLNIIVWGLYVIAVMFLLDIPKSGISIITAGLATGVGFAMKDLLNNFFYGMSLMAGRLRVGDFIDCNGVQGKVESISYQSTQIVTLDGAVMSILNSNLLSNNFKNLTRNHNYELVKVPVGVAYGTNVNRVREIIVDALQQIVYKDKLGRNVIDQEKGFNVLLANFGESSVDLFVTYWALVSEKNVFSYRAKETIYNALNAHGIEIPFPQRDIHMKP